MIGSSNRLRQNTYLRLLVKLLTIFIIIVFFDFIIGNLLERFYFKQTSGLEYRTTYSIEKTTANLLIFGPSSAIHDYVSKRFEKRLNLSCYDVGRGGITIFYDYAILKTILKRYNPKMIILDFDFHEFKKDQESYDRLSCLLPYYKKHPEIQDIVDLKSRYEKYKLFSKIYPYNSSILSIGVGNMESNKERQADINGYVPLTTILNDSIKDGNTFINYEADDNKLKIYECFIKECIKAKIELYIICSPVFIKPNYTNNFVVSAKAIADKYKIKFLDYSRDSVILGNQKFFADISHLNSEGAIVYSDRVIDRILVEKNPLSTQIKK